jgi:hypothetical protein
MVFCFFAESFKIQFEQAGLLTYPLCIPFPDYNSSVVICAKFYRNYSSGNCAGIAEQNDSPVSLLILK